MVDDVAIIGVGMHPWGKWGRNFVEYGVAAIRAAVEDAGIDYRDIQFVAGADTMTMALAWLRYPGAWWPWSLAGAVTAGLAYYAADLLTGARRPVFQQSASRLAPLSAERTANRSTAV